MWYSKNKIQIILNFLFEFIYMFNSIIIYEYSFSFLLTRSAFFLCVNKIFTKWIFFLINEQKFYPDSVTISFSSEQNFTSPLFRSEIPVLQSRKSMRCGLKPRRYQLLISPALSSLALLFYLWKICT